MHVLLGLVAIANTVVSHLSIASLMSGIGKNPSDPITIAGIRTDTGTVLVAVFLGFMALAAICFQPGKNGKAHKNGGMGILLFIVFFVVMYAVGLMAH